MTYPHPQVVDDPFESASNAQLAPREFYGQIQIDAWFCALVKGAGKVPYDAQVHERRNTAIDLSVMPLADLKITFPLQRSMIAESREWAGIVWASLKALGLNSTREAHGKWCKFTWTGTGRKYSKDGEEKESTTFKFLELFDTEDQCRAAYWLSRGGQPLEEIEDDLTPQTAAANKEKETAFEFLKVLVSQHRNNPAELAAQIAKMDMIKKYFTIDSPEVRELLVAA